MSATAGGVEGVLGFGPRPTREYRAQWTFAVAAIWVVVILMLAGQAGARISGAGLLLGPILAAVVYGIAAAGLSSRAAWARYAMAPLLQVLLVTGLISMLLALLHASIQFPIGSILAWWALRASPSPLLGPIPLSSAVGGLLIVGAVLSGIFSLLAG